MFYQRKKKVQKLVGLNCFRRMSQVAYSFPNTILRSTWKVPVLARGPVISTPIWRSGVRLSFGISQLKFPTQFISLHPNPSLSLSLSLWVSNNVTHHTLFSSLHQCHSHSLCLSSLPIISFFFFFFFLSFSPTIFFYPTSLSSSQLFMRLWRHPFEDKPKTQGWFLFSCPILCSFKLLLTVL